LEYSIRALGNFSSFGFLSVGIVCWQKTKVLKSAAGSMKHNRPLHKASAAFCWFALLCGLDLFGLNIQ